MSPSTKDIEQQIVTAVEMRAAFWNAVHNRQNGYGFFSSPTLPLEKQKKIVDREISKGNIPALIEYANANDMAALVKINANVLDIKEVKEKIAQFTGSDKDIITKNVGAKF
ncbi:MAG: hypothetical protein A3F17_04765 [Gammaproteobacteria bacterium RIFCSPHIGHO2_12_FULL_41_15]|nr:MAG: hypothetical protein A3F17_04765 [Gammaproteobacteria bacterium RIFCSPHIGHO2_12_FULL_41_15]